MAFKRVSKGKAIEQADRISNFVQKIIPNKTSFIFLSNNPYVVEYLQNVEASSSDARYLLVLLMAMDNSGANQAIWSENEAKRIVSSRLR